MTKKEEKEGDLNQEEEQALLNKIDEEKKQHAIEEKILKEGHKKEKAKNKKLSKKIKVLIAVCILLLAAVGFFMFSIFRINVSDELTIKLTPLQKSIIATDGDKIILDFNIKNENFAQCSAVCEFSFIDISTNTTLATSKDEIKHKKTITKSFEVTAPKTGEGQILYEFNAVCNNQKTFVCITSEDKRYASSFITIKYNLNDQDAKIKTEYKTKLEELNNNIIETKANFEQLNNINLQIPNAITEFEQIPNYLENANIELSTIDGQNQQLLVHWTNEEYSTVKSIYDEKYNDEIVKINNETKKFISIAKEISQNRNKTISSFQKINSKSDDLIKANDFLSQNKNEVNNAILEKLNNDIKSLFELKNIINRNIIHSEENTTNQITILTNNLMNSLDEYSNIDKEVTTLINYINSILSEKNINTSSSKKSCELLTEQITIIKNQNKISNDLFKNYSTNLSEIEIQEFENNIELAQRFIYTKANATEYFNSSEYNEINAIPFIKFATIDIQKLENDESKLCVNASQNPIDNNALNRIKTESFNAEPININLKEINKSKEPINENKPLCCINNECNICCQDWICNQNNFSRSNSYPIILVHGHSFNEGNSPEASIALFNDMQNKLQEEGYLSMGQIDLNSEENDNTKGIWGGFSKTPTMKASYYYIISYSVAGYDVSVKNQEGIENYAIRLREIIDKAKEQTGSDKVIIIAHSMGGLVAREYVYLFGESSVDKIITINTPQNGISGRTMEYCTLFGAKKECEDLSAGSILLSRLNAKPTSKNLPIYAIRTVGCKMDNNEIGDGVVTNQSGILKGAVNIELPGNCTDSLQTDLHNNALNPEKYPEVYNKVVEILKN